MTILENVPETLDKIESMMAAKVLFIFMKNDSTTCHEHAASASARVVDMIVICATEMLCSSIAQAC